MNKQCARLPRVLWGGSSCARGLRQGGRICREVFPWGPAGRGWAQVVLTVLMTCVQPHPRQRAAGSCCAAPTQAGATRRRKVGGCDCARCTGASGAPRENPAKLDTRQWLTRQRRSRVRAPRRHQTPPPQWKAPRLRRCGSRAVVRSCACGAAVRSTCTGPTPCPTLTLHAHAVRRCRGRPQLKT